MAAGGLWLPFGHSADWWWEVFIQTGNEIRGVPQVTFEMFFMLLFSFFFPLFFHSIFHSIFHSYFHSIFHFSFNRFRKSLSVRQSSTLGGAKKSRNSKTCCETETTSKLLLFIFIYFQFSQLYVLIYDYLYLNYNDLQLNVIRIILNFLSR